MVKVKARAVDIYCFSGTGNTLIIARGMKEAFEEAASTPACTLWKRRTPKW